jgi:hypothetical protein
MTQKDPKKLENKESQKMTNENPKILEMPMREEVIKEMTQLALENNGIIIGARLFKVWGAKIMEFNEMTQSEEREREALKLGEFSPREINEIISVWKNIKKAKEIEEMTIGEYELDQMINKAARNYGLLAGEACQTLLGAKYLDFNEMKGSLTEICEMLRRAEFSDKETQAILRILKALKERGAI